MLSTRSSESVRYQEGQRKPTRFLKARAGRATSIGAGAIVNRFGREASGQSMVEAALLMIPLLALVFNAINLGYIFTVLVNLTSAPRSGALFCILGSATPLNQGLPPTGPGTAIGSVSYLAYQDMGQIHNGAFAAGTTAVRACSSINGITSPGTTNQITTCTTANGGTFPAVSKDPENVSSGAFPFLLDQVDVSYSFSPLIPGALFNIGGRAICGGVDTCNFTRSVKMREMN